MDASSAVQGARPVAAENEPKDSRGALVGMESVLTSATATRAALVLAARAGNRDAFGVLAQLDVNQAAPVGALEQALAIRQLDRAFDRLDPGDRLVLALRHAWDLPGIEIARLLDVPRGP